MPRSCQSDSSSGSGISKKNNSGSVGGCDDYNVAEIISSIPPYELPDGTLIDPSPTLSLLYDQHLFNPSFSSSSLRKTSRVVHEMLTNQSHYSVNSNGNGNSSERSRFLQHGDHQTHYDDSVDLAGLVMQTVSSEVISFLCSKHIFLSNLSYSRALSLLSLHRCSGQMWTHAKSCWATSSWLEEEHLLTGSLLACKVTSADFCPHTSRSVVREEWGRGKEVCLFVSADVVMLILCLGQSCSLSVVSGAPACGVAGRLYSWHLWIISAIMGECMKGRSRDKEIG